MDETGRGRERVVGRLRAEEKEVEGGGVDVVFSEEFFRGSDAEVRCGFVGGGDIALGDAGFGKDQIHIPGGVFRLESLVRFQSLGEMDRDGTDGRVVHCVIPKALCREGRSNFVLFIEMPMRHKSMACNGFIVIMSPGNP